MGRLANKLEESRFNSYSSEKKPVVFLNYTPHDIVVTGNEALPSLGIARVEVVFSAIKDGVCSQCFGEVVGLPPREVGVKLVVSAMVLAASSRKDLVAPATGHPKTVRNDKGHIVSVPGFVQKK